jgi:hypothetical protein
MRREDLMAFARRDWQLLAAMKERFWIEQKQRMSASDMLQIGEELRAAVMSRQTDWPSDEERRADLASHERVSESLQRVQSSCTR